MKNPAITTLSQDLQSICEQMVYIEDMLFEKCKGEGIKTLYIYDNNSGLLTKTFFAPELKGTAHEILSYQFEINKIETLFHKIISGIEQYTKLEKKHIYFDIRYKKPPCMIGKISINGNTRWTPERETKPDYELIANDILKANK
jgi:hypothetical protein